MIILPSDFMGVTFRTSY